MHSLQLVLHQKYGPLVRIAPNEVACSDTGAIQDVYRLQNPLEKSDFYSVWTNPAFGKHKDNFSVIDEKEHAARRRIVNNIYTLSNILKSETYIDRCSRTFIHKLGEFADSGNSVDLYQWLQMYAFDVIGELYFGRMFGFMDTSSDYKSLIHSLDVLNPVMASLAVSATYARPFILISALASSAVRSGLRALEHVVTAAKSCVSERRQQMEGKDHNGSTTRNDLLQQLLAVKQEKGEKLDFGFDEIEYEAYVALFAGSDTTAIAMRSVFYHLQKHPAILSEVQAEIDKAFPSNSYPANSPITYADAIRLTLMCAVIKEATRLHPSVGFTMPRISPSPDGLRICGVHIPAGQRIGINAHVVQRDKNVFGQDADLFRPDRWLTEDAKQLREMQRCMLNFGAGTRTCIGKNISLSEMHKLIPQILRNFDLQPVNSEEEWKHHNYWFNKQTGSRFFVKRRT